MHGVSRLGVTSQKTTSSSASSTKTNAANEDCGADSEAIVPEDEDTFDINVTKHKGQFALRKLYHESDRVILVMYSAPACGPCRP